MGTHPAAWRYTVRGAGPPLLWLSGFVVPVATFANVVDELVPRFTVVCVEHRGSGTSRSRLLPATTGAMASDAVSVLDRLGLASAHVVGVSLGGMVAQELAIARPDRVRSLVLCSTTAGGADARTPCPLTLVKDLKRIESRVPGRGRVRAWGALHQAAAAACHDATRRLHQVLAPTLILHGLRTSFFRCGMPKGSPPKFPGPRSVQSPAGPTC